MAKSILVIALILISHNVAVADEVFPDTVTWGSYCGECADRCSKFYRLTSEGLEVDESNRFFELFEDPFEYTFVGQKATDEEFKHFGKLLQNPISEILLEARGVIGLPDAYDQCGYMIVFTSGAKTYRSLIDPDMVPLELTDLVERLFPAENTAPNVLAGDANDDQMETPKTAAEGSKN